MTANLFPNLKFVYHILSTWIAYTKFKFFGYVRYYYHNIFDWVWNNDSIGLNRMIHFPAPMKELGSIIHFTVCVCVWCLGCMARIYRNISSSLSHQTLPYVCVFHLHFSPKHTTHTLDTTPYHSKQNVFELTIRWWLRRKWTDTGIISHCIRTVHSIQLDSVSVLIIAYTSVSSTMYLLGDYRQSVNFISTNPFPYSPVFLLLLELPYCCCYSICGKRFFSNLLIIWFILI